MTASPLRELRVLIVDDEKPARQRVRNLLQADTTPHSFHEAGNGEEAVRMIVNTSLLGRKRRLDRSGGVYVTSVELIVPHSKDDLGSV